MDVRSRPKLRSVHVKLMIGYSIVEAQRWITLADILKSLRLLWARRWPYRSSGGNYLEWAVLVNLDPRSGRLTPRAVLTRHAGVRCGRILGD